MEDPPESANFSKDELLRMIQLGRKLGQTMDKFDAGHARNRESLEKFCIVDARVAARVLNRAAAEFEYQAARRLEDNSIDLTALGDLTTPAWYFRRRAIEEDRKPEGSQSLIPRWLLLPAEMDESLPAIDPEWRTSSGR